ncbi:MFS general substrate transporter [Auriculariales sp. MPI-PUGE-AT-0066]|nr:MFS general substrate transporter [Auriculariales sp. MPI-PUGE-AT-0066]
MAAEVVKPPLPLEEHELRTLAVPSPAPDGLSGKVQLEAQSAEGTASVLSEPPAQLEQTPAQRRTELIRYCALLYAFVLIGWQDGSTGPLLPAIREYYQLNFTKVSLIFILGCAGGAVGSFSLFYMLEKFGFGTVLVIGAALHGIGTAIQASAPPFPAFLVCSFIVGVGMSFQDATGNGYVASLKRDASRKMGLLHAAYGLGAFASPLVATQFSTLSGRKWAFSYIVTSAVAASTVGVVSFVFRFKRMEVLFAETNEPQMNQDVKVEGENNVDKLRNILKMPLVHFLALYIALYVGVEVTMGGWVVTFIIDERGGGPNAGYISAGFFGGLMVGRIVLLPLNAWLGERRAIFLYSTLTLALDIIIWRVPSLVGNAVAASLVGLLFGPWYPIVMTYAGLALPPQVLAGAVGYIAGFGIVGAAIIPFITGALASRFEIKVMPIVVLIMTSIMIGVWGMAMRLGRKAKLD